MMRNRKTANYMPTSLRGIANRARRDKKARFRHLYTLLNRENLKWCFWQLHKKASAGVDGQSWADYAENLDTNLLDLEDRLKGKRYRARLVRRKWIPKGNGKSRPLGIPVIEDKIVQLAAARILEAIWEQDFLDCSWGYRPGRGPKEASERLADAIITGRLNWIVDADIRAYFDSIDHSWMIKMLEQRVDDRAFINLIRKWLKAGILEENQQVIHPATGTPQGGIVSPVLANIYLHFVLDLWVSKVVQPDCKGQVLLMRFADDFVCAFQTEHEARKFHANLPARMKEFGLQLAEEKTHLVRFSRFEIEENGYFDFLGFRFTWCNSRKGKPRVQRKTSPKKLQASVAAFKEWIKENRHQRTHVIMNQLRRKLTGYWNYYGAGGNFPALNKFWRQIKRLLFKWLNRRSHKKSYNWPGFIHLLEEFRIPGPRITESVWAHRELFPSS